MSARPGPMPVATGDARAQLSCLLDGELAEGERPCLDALCADAGLQRDWALWHAVGDALRSSEVAALHSAGFAARVSQALQAEPAIVAPRALQPGRRMIRRVVLPGAAAAAAAVMLTVVAVPMLRGGDAPRVELAAGNRAAGAVPAAAGVQPPEPTPAQVARVDRSPELDAYLQAHRQMSGGMGLPRTAQYLRHASAVAPER